MTVIAYPQEYKKAEAKNNALVGLEWARLDLPVWGEMSDQQRAKTVELAETQGRRWQKTLSRHEA